MNKKFLILAIMICMSFVAFPEAYACTCLANPDKTLLLLKSDFAFVGAVKTIDNSDGPQMVLFEVLKDIKGNIEGDKFLLTNTGVINNPDGSWVLGSTCDPGYQIGGLYEVYVKDGTSNLCESFPISGFVVEESYNYFPMIFVAIGIVAFSLFIWKKRQ